MTPPPPLTLVAALIQLKGPPLSGGTLSGSADLRLEKARGGDTPVLNLRAQEGGMLRLLLDTGASSTMVTPALASRLGLPSQPLSSREIELAGGGSLCAGLNPRRTRLPSLELAGADQQGQLHLSGVEALVLPVAALPPGIDGVLGVPSLRQLPLWIDPQGKRMALGPAALKAAQIHDLRRSQPSPDQAWAERPRHSLGASSPKGTIALDNNPSSPAQALAAETSSPQRRLPHRMAGPKLQLPLRWQRGVPLLQLSTPAGSVSGLADTGAEGLFISPRLVSVLLPLSPPQPLRLAGICGEQAVELRRYGGLSLGGHGQGQAPSVEAIRTENPIFSQLGVEAIVGQELMRNHAQLWRLERQPPLLELR
jgi:hypothetical protein